MSLATTSRLLTPLLDRLSVSDLDAVPYGIVQLDAEGRVLTLNRAEARSCGLGAAPIGARYFVDVHPSARAPEFHGRFKQAAVAHKYDDTFGFTLTCGPLPRRVQVRLYYSMRTSSVWIFTGAPDGSALQALQAGLAPLPDACALGSSG